MSQSIKSNATQSIINLLNLSPNSEVRIGEVLKKSISYEPKVKNWFAQTDEPDCIYNREQSIDLDLVDKINEIGLVKAYIKFLLADLMANPQQGLYLFDGIIIRNNNRIVFRARNETSGECLLVINLNDTVSAMIKK
jgi:hypothetical protein